MTSIAKLLFVAIASLIASTANAFQIETSVFLFPRYVQATACNNYYAYPILCRTTAFGMNQYGVWVNTWEDAEIGPGQCASTNVYANYPYYFIGSNGTSECRF